MGCTEYKRSERLTWSFQSRRLVVPGYHKRISLHDFLLYEMLSICWLPSGRVSPDLSDLEVCLEVVRGVGRSLCNITISGPVGVSCTNPPTPTPVVSYTAARATGF